MENGSALVGSEETHALGAGQMDKEIRVWVAMERGVCGCAAKPDTGGIDVAFAGFED